MMKRIMSSSTVWVLLLMFTLLPVSPVMAGSVAEVEIGEDDGMITIASFTRLLKERPDDFYWYDVREPEEVKADGSFSKAITLSVDELEKVVAELPTDKPIIFFCATGARSGEAYDIVKMKREGLQVYFLDANVEFAGKDFPKVLPPD
ncbi:MAG: hypothetical protein GY731_16915 [Gammaproteobacteria bacterium]|nr:hypothetical protein [Gammaproteobacteria bacterium]